MGSIFALALASALVLYRPSYPPFLGTKDRFRRGKVGTPNNLWRSQPQIACTHVVDGQAKRT